MAEKTPTNKMATMSIPRLLLSMGTPMVISLLIQALYNIVDSAFVSNMPNDGEAGLNALTLVFPLQVFMIAIGIGTGVGVNVLVSKSLGEKDTARASRACGNAIFLGFIIYIIFVLFGIFGTRAYIASQTSNEQVIDMATSYLRICMVVSFGVVFHDIFEKILQACGHPEFSTIAQITGALVNMILDPIFIYGYLGLPAMGIKGAAYATIIGQIIAGSLAVIFHFRFDKDISNHPRNWKPSGRIIRDIYRTGFPAIVAQALMSVMTYGMNIVLIRIGESMVTAYGLFYKIQQFVLFAAFGIRDAITPIVSFNRGYGSRERMERGMKYGLLYTLVLMIIGIIIVETLAIPFCHMFGLTGITRDYFLSAEHIITISFLFAGINVAFQGIFQAIDGGGQSLIVSLCRQVVFIFPFACLFTWLINRDYVGEWTVWTTFIIAEALSAVLSAILFHFAHRKINRKLSPTP